MIFAAKALNYGELQWSWPFAEENGESGGPAIQVDRQQYLAGKMTEKLYYRDPFLLEFQARVLRRLSGKQGCGLVLDRTAFYPGGGGQPPDGGTIEGMPLLAVTQEGETPIHWVVDDPGVETVQCRVDARRRMDAMQQHTGQHLISACLLKVADVETVSVHFGEQDTAVEIDCAALDRDRILQAEALANQVVAEARPVKAYWVTSEKIQQLPLRKVPPVRDQIRIVEIEQLDWSACGGTHVLKTSQVGPVVFASQEKIRGRLRLRWLIGDRVRAAFHRQAQWLQALAVQLTSGPEELLERVARLLEERKTLSRRVNFLSSQLSELLAESLYRSAREVGKWKLVSFQGEKAHGPEFLKLLMQQFLRRPGVVAVLACPIDATTSLWMLGVSDAASLHVSRWLPSLLPVMGDARGGGRGPVWQGKCTGPLHLDAFVQALSRQLSEVKSGEKPV